MLMVIDEKTAQSLLGSLWERDKNVYLLDYDSEDVVGEQYKKNETTESITHHLSTLRYD